MGGVFWINSPGAGSISHTTFTLFPGQMIVEHAHEATAKGKPKMETWHIRNGSIYNFGRRRGRDSRRGRPAEKPGQIHHGEKV